MSYRKRLIARPCFFSLAILAGALFFPGRPAQAGDYLVSAHGSTDAGVNRGVTSTAGYGRGNCGHCHEMHASLEGQEPAPAGGAPSDYAVFAKNFDTAFTAKPYTEASNFCFYCHNSPGSAQTVTNSDYGTTFGGGSGGPASILAAFNQASYHNLNDIRTFVRDNSGVYPAFTDSSNPCNACHNPHLAKRNWVSTLTGFPLNSAISKPSAHFGLWGESETMASHVSYEAPYSSGTNREPAGVGDADGSNTPDYVGFCTDCHNSANTIWSTSLGRDLRPIDWSGSAEGEKHGGYARDVGIISRNPFAAAAGAKSNFILSCLDCHEPHGSPNIMLLRRRINGEDLEGTVTTVDSSVLGYVCRRCHQDDLIANAGTTVFNKWRYVHHDAADRPYVRQAVCTTCHIYGQGFPIPCGFCHGHGMTDSWVPSQVTGRKTF
ncbi:hypothetical protein ACUUL3_11430 [Thiovibrio sp. JS02]